MTPDRFRALALALPEAVEAEHQRHPDFRVGGRIFATLGPDGTWGMVRLLPDEQEERIRARPAVFSPSPGAWGRQGCTQVRLARAGVAEVRSALRAAWRRTAPPAVRRRHPDA